ncbi:hypothetical protein DPMN_052255, partial [Dreissena polymorpha]
CTYGFVEIKNTGEHAPAPPSMPFAYTENQPSYAPAFHINYNGILVERPSKTGNIAVMLQRKTLYVWNFKRIRAMEKRSPRRVALKQYLKVIVGWSLQQLFPQDQRECTVDEK